MSAARAGLHVQQLEQLRTEVSQLLYLAPCYVGDEEGKKKENWPQQCEDGLTPGCSHQVMIKGTPVAVEAVWPEKKNQNAVFGGGILVTKDALDVLGAYASQVMYALESGLIVHITTSTSVPSYNRTAEAQVLAPSCQEQEDRKRLMHGLGAVRSLGSAASHTLAGPLLLFELMSVAVGQYYMHEINAKLHGIEKAVARAECQYSATLIGALHSCEQRVDELEEELSLESLPGDWDLRLVHVHAEATTALCRAEVAFAAFMASMDRIAKAPNNTSCLELAADITSPGMAAAHQDYALLIAHIRLTLRLRQLVYMRDVRMQDQRTDISLSRWTAALQNAQKQLLTFACLEKAVCALEDALDAQSWLRRHIVERDTASKVAHTSDPNPDVFRLVPGETCDLEC